MLCGVLVLALANAALIALNPLAKVDPEDLPSSHTYVWWAAKEFFATKPAPDTVFLGSSFAMHPLARVDADYLGEDFDLVHHRRCAYIENALAERLGVGNSVSFNFAIPGGMASDQYLITRAVLCGERKPRLVVSCVSMRDFNENQLKCAGATQAFRFFKRFTDIDEIVDLAMPQVWQRLDYYLGKALYLHGRKLDIQVLLAEKTKELLRPAVAAACAPSLLAQSDPARNAPLNLRAEVEEGMFIVRAHEPYSFADNSAEYKKRYRTANEGTFKVQAAFYEKFLNLCHRQGTEVVIVNMPLTKRNRDLMPPGAYERYTAYLKDAAARHRLPFVDLSASRQFTLRDFFDTSHLNGSGGKKFVDAVLSEVSRHPSIVRALRPAVERSLAGRGDQM